jgi:dTDP-4-amino-4,6-dideoxygalactose transaminase
MQAAILSVKLDLLGSWNQNRFRAACYYAERLRENDAVQVPIFDHQNPARHVFHLFVIQCEQRDSLLKFLQNQGIECGVHYPVPIHLQKAYVDLGWREGDFPLSETFAKKILSLPMFPEIRDEQMDRVVEAIRDFFNG